MKAHHLNLTYDPSNDILYISIGAPRPSYGDDLFDGTILRYDLDTDELTGVTIFECKQKYLCNSPELLKLVEILKLPTTINFEHVLFS